MAKNQVQKGLSLPEFLQQYGTEEQCRGAVYGWRWPDGFRCPECGHTGHCEIVGRGLYQCHRCHHQTSLISGTLFEYTKLPLTTWFLGMYFLTQPKNGTSVLELRRELGISYNAAWRLKHKLLQAMKERDDSQPLKCQVRSITACRRRLMQAGLPEASHRRRQARLYRFTTKLRGHRKSMIHDPGAAPESGTNGC